MILTEVKKIKVALSELRRSIPVKMENFTTAKSFQCKELLPINSLDELKVYDSCIKNGTDFKADFVRKLRILKVNFVLKFCLTFVDGIPVDVRW